MSSRIRALLAIILASLLWSTAGLAKIIVLEFDPYFAAFLRFFVASLVILPIFIKTNTKQKHLLRDLVPLSLLPTINILFYYLGLSVSTANAATLVYAGAPMLTAILAHYLIKERLGAQKILGIMIGFIGILFITTLSVSGTLTGNISFILAVVFWSFYTIGSRRAITEKGYSPVTITALFFFTATIIFFIISLFTYKASYIPILVRPQTIFLILHLGIFVTVATYLLYQWVVKHASATTASLNNYIGPIFSIIVNAIFLQETVTPLFLVGAALVMMGIIIASGSGLLREMKEWVNR